ncbi:MAG TPA: triose-phosphate isomerase [Thermomicrobiales bacterium]|jgi:triosephosphate isomerase
MRTPIIAGNWKMHTTYDAAMDLVEALMDELDNVEGAEVVLCPPFPWLLAVAEYLEETPILLGAQDCYWADEGAFTGEVSALMLKDLAQYCIVGHSERRGSFGETDETVNKKVLALLGHGIRPICCVGERLEQREAGETDTFVTGQVRAAFAGVSVEDALNVVVAYEPIWAIGTGRAASAEEANRVLGLIRREIAALYGAQTAEGVRIQYGGSVSGRNAAELMAQPEIDGALVGGASLRADEFAAIVRAAAER